MVLAKRGVHREQRKRWGLGNPVVLLLALLLSLLLNLSLATAADVTFKVGNMPTSITVGQTFQFDVLLDAEKEISQVQFKLTPQSEGITITSATSGGLLANPTITSNKKLKGGVYQYGEKTSGSTSIVPGTNNLKFVTLTATANKIGTFSLTFSSLVATKGSSGKTKTSLPGTVTVSGCAQPCTEASWSVSEFSSCLGPCGSTGTQTRTVTKVGSCEGGVAEPATSQSCTTDPCPEVVVCGDNIISSGEACDDGNTLSEAECAYGTESCSGCSGDCLQALSLTGPFCGDSVKNGQEGAEDCDNNDLGGAGCQSISGDFIGGALQCAEDCTFNTEQCQEVKGKGKRVCEAVTDDDFEGEGALGRVVSKLAKKLKDIFVGGGS